MVQRQTPRQLSREEKIGLIEALKALYRDKSVSRRRRWVTAVSTVLGVYAISPIDLVPEAVLGPLGLIDDAGALTTVGVVVFNAARYYQGVWMQRQTAVAAQRAWNPEGSNPQFYNY